ncbi:MAG: metalloregulator ArsR/SmtB family transcription factor [Pseudomonadota bacterium]|nr:metalloregulator ArsR/SmtB family transcription factor [Pseudomonadota bacterium]
MAEFIHPNLADVPLTAALHALSDPARLAMVRNLAGAGELNCECALPSCAAPKSTRSNHLKVLRAAGLIETRREGRELFSRLRKKEFEARFPGLLRAVLKAE